MIKFVKGDKVKYVDPNSALIPRLKADGWSRPKGRPKTVSAKNGDGK